MYTRNIRVRINQYNLAVAARLDPTHLPGAPQTLAIHVIMDWIRAQLDGAHSWLSQNVKGKFWVDMKAWFDQQNQTYRDLLCSRNIRDGLREHKTFLKRTSYAGAVRLPTWCPDGWTTYTSKDLILREMETI